MMDIFLRYQKGILLDNMNESFTFIGGASIQGYIEISPYPNGGDIAVEFHFIERNIGE